MRVPPSNSRGLSALGISGEDEEKQQHFCHCSSPFYSAACVGSLLSVAMFGCIFSMVRILAFIAFTRFNFQNLGVIEFLYVLYFNSFKNLYYFIITLYLSFLIIELFLEIFIFSIYFTEKLCLKTILHSNYITFKIIY